jgi:hypothetical protein
MSKLNEIKVSNETWLFIDSVRYGQNNVTIHMLTLMLVVGSISNLLNIMVSSRKEMLKSIGLYYIFISIFNILVLITGWINYHPQHNLVFISGK